MNFSMRSLTQRHVESMIRGQLSIVILLILLLASCATESDDSGQLEGVWSDGWSTITINTSAKTIAFENSYEGTIENAPDFTAVNGVLIIKFTKYWESVYNTSPPYNLISHTETTANNGKYGALYWKGLTSNSVYMADAYVYMADDYDASYNHVMFDSLSSAQTNFTMDRAGDYIDWSRTSPYTK